MKLFIIHLIFVVFCLPAHGQTFAYQKPSSFPNCSCITNLERSPHKRQNNKVVIGGMMIVSGGIAAYWGAKVYIAQGTFQNTDASVGTGILVLGSAVIVTGIVFAVRGINAHHGRYGFEIIAPKSNEIGIACNF